MPTGTVDVDFGAFPGSIEAKATITGQTSLVAGSAIEAWLSPEQDTTDHTTYEQLIDGATISVLVSDKIAGTGFTIYLRPTDGVRRYGKYHTSWVWA